MTTQSSFTPFFVLVHLGLLLGASGANANLDACGGVYLDAETAASCEWRMTESCTETCEPVATEKVCASRLTETCNSECVSTAADECVTTCDESCVPACTAEAEPPNCMGLCMSDCQQDCTDACAGSPNQGHCRASCAQCCSNGCHEECDGEPETECEPVCTTACEGSCDGRANIDCQVTCQSDLYTVCEEEVVTECKDECESSGGAIFCDGQFLASGSDPLACAAALRTEFGANVDVTLRAAGDVNTDENGGDAWGLASLGCAGGGQTTHGALSLAVLGALAAVRRRRRASSSRGA